MTIQEAETQFYDIFPNAENNVIKTGITLDVRDASNNKLPLEAYKVVKTYAAAESLIERHVDPSDNTVYYYDAYPGETISVVDDIDSSLNGLYFVMGTQDPSGNGLSLHRVMYSSDASSEFRLQSKIVNPSTAAIDVQPSSGYYGLGTVHVNPIDASIDPDLVPGNIKKDVEIFGVIGTYEMNNQNKTVNSSTVLQTVTADSNYSGLATVTINPYTTGTDSSVLTANGTYTFIPTNTDALSQVTVDVSVALSGQDWYLKWKNGLKHDLSDIDLTSTINTFNGCAHMFETKAYTSFIDSSQWSSARYITAFPIMDTSVLSGAYACYYMFSGATINNPNSNTGLEFSFPTLTNIAHSFTFNRALYKIRGNGVRKISFPELVEIGTGAEYVTNTFTDFFSSDDPGMLQEVYMPKLRWVDGETSNFLNFVDDPSGASRKLTVHVDALKYRNTTQANIATSFGASLTTLVLTGTATHDVWLASNTNLSAESVLNVLNCLGTSGTGYSVNFASITISDYSDHRILTAYNTAVSNGWTINGLTIN